MVFCNPRDELLNVLDGVCHNPYFSRWFSAIKSGRTALVIEAIVTILILVDGFLQ